MRKKIITNGTIKKISTNLTKKKNTTTTKQVEKINMKQNVYNFFHIGTFTSYFFKKMSDFHTENKTTK